MPSPPEVIVFFHATERKSLTISRRTRIGKRLVGKKRRPIAGKRVSGEKPRKFCKIFTVFPRTLFSVKLFNFFISLRSRLIKK